VEPVLSAPRPPHDPQCYLCPGNARANGQRNPPYDSTYVFTNDFAAFLPDTSSACMDRHALLQARSQAGTCRVMCFSPRHDLSLAQMPLEQVRYVVQAWADQSAELRRQWRWVQLFENKGELMGCSNPHPHGQIWASDSLPNEPAKELARQQRWFAEKGVPLLLDYAAIELSEGERVVASNEHWLALVPWWAAWPFEMLLLPRRHARCLVDLSAAEKDSLAVILCGVLARYDNLFKTSFPYSFGWHEAPADDGDYACWQLHAHFHPPLLRSASVKKFMVGYELLCEPQRDLTPEQAAERLRILSDVRFE
jgi:UDPglucose--hexose-1-phosphate uridylyltransferase